MSYLRVRLRRPAVLRQEETERETEWETGTLSAAVLYAQLSDVPKEASAGQSLTRSQEEETAKRSADAEQTLAGRRTGRRESSVLGNGRSEMASRLEEKLLHLRQAVEYGGIRSAEAAVVLTGGGEPMTPDGFSRYWERDVRRYDNGF